MDAAATGDLETVRTLVSPDSVWHGIGDGGVDELIVRLEHFHAAHADVRVEVLALVTNRDKVGAHLRWRAVKGDALTGFDEIEIVRIEGDVIVEEWAVDSI